MTNKAPRDWMRVVTTGHGAMIIAPTLLAVASNAMTWDVAMPLLAAGAIGLIWPEHQKTAPAKETTTPPHVETVVAAYRMGLDHATVPMPDPNPPRPTVVSPLFRGLAMLLAAGLTVAACEHAVIEIDPMVPVGMANNAGANGAGWQPAGRP